MAIRKTDKLNKEIENLEKEVASMASTYSLAKLQANKMSQAQGQLTSLIGKFGNSLVSNIAFAGLEVREAKRAAELQKKQTALMQSQLAVEQKKLELAEWELKQSSKQVNSTKRKISALERKKVAAGGALPSIADEVQLNQLKTQLPGLQANNTLLKNNVSGAASAVSGLQSDIRDASTSISSLPFAKLNAAITITTEIFGRLWKAITEFIQNVRDVQKDLGISTGGAAAIELDAKYSAILSAVNSIVGLGATVPIQPKDIKEVIGSFRAEFGGILTKDAANRIAQEAVTRGLTGAELAKLRRQFMSQTAGDAVRAKQLSDQIRQEFIKRGMTDRDLYESVSENSEIFSRNGIKFASAMARAAADAKNIGADLSKVSQFGDNIISNYEEFLMGAAELGAMGLGLDTSRLGQIAATGSDADLFNELRTQLRNAGKDIFNLDRPTRLSVENFLGMTISQAQRLLGTGSGSGEKTLSAEQIEAERVSETAKLVNVFSGLANLLEQLKDPLGTIAASLKGMVDAASQGDVKGAAKGGAIGGGTGGFLAAALAIGAVVLTGGTVSIPMGLAALLGGTALGATGGATVGAANALPNKKKGDDVLSMAGYGKRTLVTPSGAIALNDKDNIIAYADDLVGNTRLPKGSIKKAASDALRVRKPNIPKTITDTLIAITGGGKPTFTSTDPNMPKAVLDSVAKVGKMVAGTYAASKDRIYLNPKSPNPEHTLFHEFGHRDLFYKRQGRLPKGLYSKMLTPPAETRDSYGYYGTHVKEAYAEAYASAMFLLTKFGSKNRVAKGASDSRWRNLIAYYEELTPGMTPILRSLVETEYYRDHPLGKVLTGKEPRQSATLFSSPVKKYHKGGIVGGLGEELPAILQRGEAVLSRLQIGSFTRMIDKLDKFSQINKFVNNKALEFGNKIPRVGSLMNNINQSGGVSNFLQEKTLGFGNFAKDKALGFGNFLKDKALGFTKKIPGVGNFAGGLLNKFAGGAASNLLGSFATGGLSTALSLASPLLSKIPFVGKTFGSIANAPGKLMGNALKSIGGLFGKKKTPKQSALSSIGSMFPQLEGMGENLQGLLMGSPMMANANALLSGGMVDPRMFMEMQRDSRQQPQQIQIAQDPELKQTLENAIKAGMANIGLYMDGTKVAQVLAGNMQGASTFGVLTR